MNAAADIERLSACAELADVLLLPGFRCPITGIFANP